MKLFNGWRCFLLCLPILIFFPHLLTVLEFQKNPTALHSVKSNKFDHLILGPASGQGLSDRLQCKGTKALNRTHFSKSSSTYEDDQISFVTVFTTYKSPIDRFDSVIIGNTTYNKVERSLAVLNVFINFIQMNMPQSKIFILSDPSSKLPVNRNGVLIHPIPGEYSRDKLMLQRIKSYIAFLESRLDEHSNGQGRLSHFIFTDSDIAVVDDLAHIFHENPSFDIALTFRNNKEQPLNSGFIAVRGTVEGILRAKSLLEKVLEVYSLKYMKASRMLGDQLALVWVVKSQALFDVKRFSRREGFVEKIGDTSVLFLPCLRYNWTPPEGAGQFHGMPLDVKVVHFKGSRKRLMLESWNFLSLSSEIGDMLCLILKSGRTKYDF